MAWTDNSLVWWNTGSDWQKISDHNRGALSVNYERIEHSNRMADGTLRRYVVGKKRTFSLGWENLPSRTTEGGLTTADGGMDGETLEEFCVLNDQSFLMRMRKGSDENLSIDDPSIEEVEVVITSFNKEVQKRGPKTDLWSVDVTLEEV